MGSWWNKHKSLRFTLGLDSIVVNIDRELLYSVLWCQTGITSYLTVWLAGCQEVPVRTRPVQGDPASHFNSPQSAVSLPTISRSCWANSVGLAVTDLTQGYYDMFSLTLTEVLQHCKVSYLQQELDWLSLSFCEDYMEKWKNIVWHRRNILSHLQR